MVKRILLTGGSGFVGRNLKEYILDRYNGEVLPANVNVVNNISTLTRDTEMIKFSIGSEDYELYAPSSKQLNVVDEETVTEWCTRVHFDIVLHFAVYTNAGNKDRDPERMLDLNLRSFLNFYKCRSHYGKMFYSGSGAEFNKEYEIVSAAESQLEGPEGDEYLESLIPTDKYGLMKYTIGQMINTTENIYNLRIFGLFGKYEYADRFITQMCHLNIKGEEMVIRKNVDFDYLYIDDFCNMLMQIIFKDRLKYRNYNMVSGQKHDLITLAKMVNEAAIEYREKRLEMEGLSQEEENRFLRIVTQPIVLKEEGKNNEYTASNVRIAEEIPDLQYTPMQQAIDELYEYYADEVLKEEKHD